MDALEVRNVCDVRPPGEPPNKFSLAIKVVYMEALWLAKQASKNDAHYDHPLCEEASEH